MIKSFGNSSTEKVWQRQHVRNLAHELQRAARRKLIQLNSAVTLEDLKAPPGNRLKPLKGDRQEQHSIRINDQFRICFRWNDGHAYDVEITDYH